MPVPQCCAGAVQPRHTVTCQTIVSMKGITTAGDVRATRTWGPTKTKRSLLQLNTCAPKTTHESDPSRCKEARRWLHV